jgi:hypothetical protein
MGNYLIFLKTLVMNLKNRLDKGWGFLLIFNNCPKLVQTN